MHVISVYLENVSTHIQGRSGSKCPIGINLSHCMIEYTSGFCFTKELTTNNENQNSC